MHRARHRFLHWVEGSHGPRPSRTNTSGTLLIPRLRSEAGHLAFTHRRLCSSLLRRRRSLARLCQRAPHRLLAAIRSVCRSATDAAIVMEGGQRGRYERLCDAYGDQATADLWIQLENSPTVESHRPRTLNGQGQPKVSTELSCMIQPQPRLDHCMFPFERSCWLEPSLC